MSFRFHPYSKPRPHPTHHQNMKSQSYHDVFGRIVLSPATSYSNDDEDLVDYDEYIESLRNIPPSTLQNPCIPPNYPVMPSHLPTSIPSPNQPSLQSSTPITLATPINPPSLTCESPRKFIEEPQENPSSLDNESSHVIQPCEVISDEASLPPTSIMSPPSPIATIPIPSIKLLKILPLPTSLNILLPIKSLQNSSTSSSPPSLSQISRDDPYKSMFYSPISTTESPIYPSTTFEESIPSPPIAPSTTIQSYQDPAQKHVDIPQSIKEDIIVPCLPSIMQSPSPPSPKPQAIPPLL